MAANKNIPAVLGVGNALVDVISIINDESILEQFGLPKGSMTLVDSVLSEKIYSSVYSEKSELSTGGSVANTMRTLAGLGGKGGYLGKTGNDEFGLIFKEAFEKKGIRTHLSNSSTGTGRVMGLVTPDSERTMATFLGAAAELTPADFYPAIFEGYEYLYMEGYLVFNHELIKTGVEMAKASGLKVAIDLASYNVVEVNRDFLKELISKNVDIVFANEEEAKSLTGKEPLEALYEISEMCELAVVKLGKEGSYIKRGDEVLKVGTISANAIDTTGAGDSYAAGFFYGLTNGYNLETCGKIAALVSGKTVEVIGANLPDHQWLPLKEEMRKIIRQKS
jgi:sugar/nucleoside kinase (ribokinase family)